MSHAYAPAPAHANASAPAHVSHLHTPTPPPAHATEKAHANSGSTCVTPKWAMPLDIGPSHALPLCACGTPMHLLHCVEGSNHVTHAC
ncbi:hypothetical protein O181_048784 [Austropuccinia psidii MF-1]|uniref:Uncharacterized protein n=1 Tax=Austropuccinia psidii MF-1 TaxID=1389203 RepID=A0A9Q3DTM8_9BASI|nr:hypothetical protein [Austropuccinia psidii MF-1]